MNIRVVGWPRVLPYCQYWSPSVLLSEYCLPIVKSRVFHQYSNLGALMSVRVRCAVSKESHLFYCQYESVCSVSKGVLPYCQYRNPICFTVSGAPSVLLLVRGRLFYCQDTSPICLTVSISSFVLLSVQESRLFYC
jgi:hypothetical protein